MCIVENCGKLSKSKGYCSSHYRNNRLYGDPLKTGRFRNYCTIGNCNQPVKGKNLCIKHYTRLIRNGDPEKVTIAGKNLTGDCKVIENNQKCANKFIAKEMCGTHYKRWKLHGDPLLGARGKNKTAKYKVIRKHGHPNARSNGNILEHRWVMAEYLGRALLPNENIHHKNGNGFDNRLSNLELWNTSQPYGQRIPDKVNWAIEILSLYAPDKLRNLDG